MIQGDGLWTGGMAGIGSIKYQWPEYGLSACVTGVEDALQSRNSRTHQLQCYCNRNDLIESFSCSA